jgi:hypothetical protein
MGPPPAEVSGGKLQLVVLFSHHHRQYRRPMSFYVRVPAWVCLEAHLEKALIVRSVLGSLLQGWQDSIGNNHHSHKRFAFSKL